MKRRASARTPPETADRSSKEPTCKASITNTGARISEGISPRRIPRKNSRMPSCPPHKKAGTRSHSRKPSTDATWLEESSQSSTSKSRAPTITQSRWASAIAPNAGVVVTSTSQPASRSASISCEKHSERASAKKGTSSNTTRSNCAGRAISVLAIIPASKSRRKHGLEQSSQ